ncbi:prolyl oligopeptidase family serine peptidase [Alteribacter keqinensis]|uniref:Phospholipase n=1 Tax=Alteribacter keqinensis TaxID=2483800 RepID=A0A3M7TS56_9BACI|nr:prolyl oligopeptidase family serine peptidase [Alteribacter keqinensis]RNA68436.1 phospholipase [Alteribacter keqinensis]
MELTRTFQKAGYKLPYLLHLPDDVQETDEKLPLILFLHGAGERGTDINPVRTHGIFQNLDMAEDFIIVAPQCSEQSYWVKEIDGLSALLDDLEVKYPVDPDRVYLTGLSMGGIGAWHLALENPDRFAAIVPVCGGLSVPSFRREQLGLTFDSNELFSRLSVLTSTSVWAFHGEKDDVIPMNESVNMIAFLQKEGGKAAITVYENVGHDSWVQAYSSPELYKWLISKKRHNK